MLSLRVAPSFRSTRCRRVVDTWRKAVSRVSHVWDSERFRVPLSWPGLRVRVAATAGARDVVRPELSTRDYLLPHEPASLALAGS
ncbi:hypothetical protein PsYK624_066640 [Phanerochaete sordida]|uniref:Uncharacterized protein n=1 Tax=Phanerochaete sordida TaxID=48140 RepID=A0A9P3G9Z2_9APHY|nr:hypothetical protein PsYK624_066640 [Phanerochaete sordida]